MVRIRAGGLDVVILGVEDESDVVGMGRWPCDLKPGAPLSRTAVGRKRPLPDTFLVAGHEHEAVCRLMDLCSINRSLYS